MRAVIALSLFLAANAMAAQSFPPSAEQFRYELRPGDHLVYRETFERTVRSRGGEFVAVYEWDTHVLVGSVREGLSAVGFQRNRTATRLVRAREGGRNVLNREQAGFDERVAALPARFAEGNKLDGWGWPQGPWSAAREAQSEALFGFHEIEPVPRTPVTVGQAFAGGSALGLEYRLLEPSTAKAAGCRVLEGRSEAFRSRATHCDGLGPTSLEAEARYEVANAEVREAIRFERVAVRRDETLQAWLSDPGLALGVLAAAHHAPWLAVPPEIVAALAARDDAQIARQARSLRDRRKAGAVIGRAPAARGCAQPPVPDALPGTTLRGLTADGLRGWPYVLHVPAEVPKGRGFPLVVYLGGGSGRALHAMASAREWIADDRSLVALPHADGMWWEERSQAILDALLAELLARPDVDHGRVFVAGVSNGATGAYRLATRRPDTFAAVSLLMGAGPFVQRSAPATANLEGLDLLVLHGADDAVIPSSFHRRTVAKVREEAPAARLTEAVLAGRGHDLFPASDGGRTRALFDRTSRDTFPRRVRLVARGPARRSWVELPEAARGTADVTATLEAGTIRLATRGAGRVRLLLRAELVEEGTPLRVERDGRTVWEGVARHDAELLARTCEPAGDPARAFSMVVEAGG